MLGPWRQASWQECSRLSGEPRKECPPLSSHPDVGQFSLGRDLSREGGREDGGGVGPELSWDPCVGRPESSLAQPAAEVTRPPPADTLQTHSGLFLEELEMLVPSTPTSASGAFWKGSELGTEPQAQPAAPSTTSEVVKSKSASHAAWKGDPYSASKAQCNTPAPSVCSGTPPPPPQPSKADLEGREGRTAMGQPGGHGAGRPP